MKKVLAGLATILGLVACGEDAPYGSIEKFSARDSMEPYFFTATSRGPLLVDIHGSYLGFEGTDVVSAITKGMERGMQTRPFKATTRMEEAESPAYRVIWVIAPPKNYNANRICKGDIPQSVPGDKATFAIVFCVDDEVYRNMSGWMHKDFDATSEHFTKFVGVVTRDLFK
ncbi:hypothetical protein [Terasakiella sp.]|uniref:hypothetical protein n=1 Tax=Terasakiella sp. TaxID=2034861 RepID=UPI003AA924F2